MLKSFTNNLFLGKRVLAAAAVLIAIGYVGISHILAMMQYVEDELTDEKDSLDAIAEAIAEEEE